MGLKKNLLIVDKNDVNRKILREMLYNTYNILEADNSGDAINMLDNETEKIACIILDLVTPEENDFNFLEIFILSLLQLFFALFILITYIY